jgi:hypothetical protein
MKHLHGIESEAPLMPASGAPCPSLTGTAADLDLIHPDF